MTKKINVLRDVTPCMLLCKCRMNFTGVIDTSTLKMEAALIVKLTPDYTV